MTACTKCGTENPEEARFCLACGTELGDEQPLPQVRKTVTVVFSDVTGSTALGEQLDPESVWGMMSRYFDEMKAVLEAHGGTVEKFIGDAVMAVFGIPLLHEDDPLRAVRAAAEMRERLERLNEELVRDRGVELRARVGVNTGEVVAGDARLGQRFASGDAVNVAARLEQAAAPGEILIGETTYGLVRDAARVEAVAPLEAKGKAGRLVAFRLLEVLPDAPARARRLDTPMVGRRRECALLADAFERTVQDRACQLFTILGPAGVGKSRLAAEFLAQLGDRATVMRGRCLPYGEGITYWPVVEAVSEAASIAAGTPAEARAQLEEVVPDAAVAGPLAHVLGLDERGAEQEDIFWAVSKLFESLARTRPLVVLFDDVQWGEPTFLDLVEHVADWSRDAPILLLVLARPELLDERPTWGGGKLNATTVLLEPLSPPEAAELITNLLGPDRLPTDVEARIAEAAEGNPLFVEEMVAMLVDDGLLRRRDGEWVAAEEIADVSVPPTIQALLAARLDRLGRAERAVLERAAVEGQVFHRSALEELTAGPVRADLSAYLMALVRKELIRPESSTLARDEAFRFRHLLIRDAAYEALPKALRAELHERLADWLEQRSGAVVEHEEVVGYHLERAYLYRAELGPLGDGDRRLAARAAERLGTAGLRAMDRGDLPAAKRLLTRAISLGPPEERDRVMLELALAQVLAVPFHEQERERALARVDELLAVSQSYEDPVLRAHVVVARRLARAAGGVIEPGEAAEIERDAREAIAVFEQHGDDDGLEKAWRLRAWPAYLSARSEDTAQSVERAIVHGKRVGRSWGRIIGVSYLLNQLTLGPTPVAPALERWDELLRGETSPALRIWALDTRAQLEAMAGRIAAARELVERVRALGLEVDVFGYSELAPLRLELEVELLAGDLDRAARATEDLLRSAPAPWYRVGGARVRYRQGRYPEARRLLDAAPPAEAFPHAAFRTERLALEARLLAREGRHDEAERAAVEAVDLLAASDYLNHRADAFEGLAEVRLLAGRRDAALEPAREAVALYERKKNLPAAARARVLLDEVPGAAAPSG